MTTKSPSSSSEVLVYQSAEGSTEVQVRLDGDTVWLTQRQMADLFGTTPENVLMHLQNIFSDDELDETATAKDFLAVQIEGKRQVAWGRASRTGCAPTGNLE